MKNSLKQQPIDNITNKPLLGIKVLDLSRVLAGPWCTQQLADLGADVIKVEKPILGDDTRHWGPPFIDLHGTETAAYFLSSNRGKDSIALDFSDAEDHQVLLKLVSQADVVVHNFLPKTVEKYKIDYENLTVKNNKLIYCSISGYGSNGSYASKPGYDALIQAEAGLMHITGEDEPVKVGVAVTDLFTGMYATQAIIAAIYQREKTNFGKKIEIALFDTQFQMLANQAMNYLISSTEPSRMGSAHPNIVPYQVFQSADLPFMLAVGNDQQFESLCSSLNLSKLLLANKSNTNANRVRNRVWLVGELQIYFAVHRREWILEQLGKAGVPVAPLQNFNELFNSEIVKERELVKEFSTTGLKFKYISGPIQMDDKLCLSEKPPPALDKNRQEILCRWLNAE